MVKKLIYSIVFIVGLSQSASAQEIVKWKLDDLKAAIKDSDKPTVINFWATFCLPCIEEIRYFQQIVKKYDSAGVQLVLVSLDLKASYPKKISGFAKRMKFTAPITFLAETNADLFCPVVDESWSGAIPASLFINNNTGYRKFFEAELGREKFEKEIQTMLRKADGF